MITIRWYDKKDDIEAKAMRQSIQLSGHESVRQKIRCVPASTTGIAGAI